MVVRKVSELGDLSVAERQVLDELDSGETIVLADASVPAAGDERRRVRAGLIRLLLLSEDPEHRPHEKGLRILGAWITDQLDLEGCRIPRDIALLHCRFDVKPALRSAMIDNLFLNGSALPGLAADRLEARGGVVLRGVNAGGEIRLPGAKLGGDLDCVGATFRAKKDAQGNPSCALAACGLEVRGSVLLRGVDATGEVRLLGAKLGGSLDCDGATFRAEKDAQGKAGDTLSAEGLETKGSVLLRGVEATGAIRLPGVKLGVDLDCSGANFRVPNDVEGASGDALCLVGAGIDGTFFLRDGACVEGILDLTAAEIGTLCDAARCWPSNGDLLLDRCRYGAFIRRSPVDASSRLDWLDRQDPTLWGADFWPQPYEQCAKVLLEMGYGEDARKIAIEKERRQRTARRAHAEPPLRWGLSTWDAVLGMTVRYGRQPLLAFVWLLGFWLYGAGVFYDAEQAGVLKPNKEIVLLSDAWQGCAEAGRGQLACFLATPKGQSYPHFNALVYSADTLLPIVSLEMQDYWIPDDRKGWAGWGARVYLWIHIGVGWALSLLAVAGFSGLVKSD